VAQRHAPPSPWPSSLSPRSPARPADLARSACSQRARGPPDAARPTSPANPSAGAPHPPPPSPVGPAWQGGLPQPPLVPDAHVAQRPFPPPHRPQPHGDAPAPQSRSSCLRPHGGLAPPPSTFLSSPFLAVPAARLRRGHGQSASWRLSATCRCGGLRPASGRPAWPVGVAAARHGQPARG
jgi:hypothetical protein